MFIQSLSAAGRRRGSSTSFLPDAVDIGTNTVDIYRNSALVGASSQARYALMSVWSYWPSSFGSTRSAIMVHNAASSFSGPFFNVVLNDNAIANNYMRIAARGTNNAVFGIDFFGTHPVGRWFHTAISIDFQYPLDCQCYVDGSAVSSPSTTSFHSAISFVNFSGMGNLCGLFDRDNLNDGESAYGSFAEYYFTNPSSFIDLSTDIGKFYNSGIPVDLGSDGSTPTGTQPLIYVKGPASNVNSGANFGSGGTFSITNTALDADAIEPVSVS